MKLGKTLRVLRDSDDLGLDRGMKCIVLRVRGAKMDIVVPALDSVISGIPVNQPDLGPA